MLQAAALRQVPVTEVSFTAAEKLPADSLSNMALLPKAVDPGTQVRPALQLPDAKPLLFALTQQAPPSLPQAWGQGVTAAAAAKGQAGTERSGSGSGGVGVGCRDRVVNGQGVRWPLSGAVSACRSIQQLAGWEVRIRLMIENQLQHKQQRQDTLCLHLTRVRHLAPTTTLWQLVWRKSQGAQSCAAGFVTLEALSRHRD